MLQELKISNSWKLLQFFSLVPSLSFGNNTVSNASMDLFETKCEICPDFRVGHDLVRDDDAYVKFIVCNHFVVQTCRRYSRVIAFGTWRLNVTLTRYVWHTICLISTPVILFSSSSCYFDSRNRNSVNKRKSWWIPLPTYTYLRTI